MKQIWKYPLETVACQWIEIGEGAEFLSVMVQNGIPTIWFKADPDAQCRTCKIVTYGTGMDFDDGPLVYIGSYQLDGGAFVGHVFEDTGLV